MTLPGHDFCTPRYVISTLCLLAVCAILVATLWPFHSPKNQVSWVYNDNAVLIGHNGTILSSGVFGLANSDGLACSLELWFEPAVIWTGRTLLAFHDPSNTTAFSMRQDNTTLVLQLGNRGEMNRGFRQMAVEDVFRKPKILLTVTADGRETAIYLNGQLAAKNMSFGLTARDLSGQLILANSPLRGDSWSGKLRGMAIYPNVLTPSEVAQSYADWTGARQSPLAFRRSAVAFYTFREHGGRIIHDTGTYGIDLYIPERFLVVDQLLLEPPWSEVHTVHSYVRDGIINVGGFIPLGFLLTSYFALVRQMRRPAVVAIVVGGSLSVTVEILQAYLPTRFSGFTDIITNTIGTALGAALYYRFATAISKRLFCPRSMTERGPVRGDSRNID